MSVLFDFPFPLDDEEDLELRKENDKRWLLVFPEDTVSRPALPICSEAAQGTLKESLSDSSVVEKLVALDEQCKHIGTQCRSFAAAGMETLAHAGFELRELLSRLGSVPSDSSLWNASRAFDKLRVNLECVRDEAHTRYERPHGP
jgi:hypothetical protein